MFGCSGGGDPLPAEITSIRPSDGGRVEVSIRVTNDTSERTTSYCRFKAFDADGYRAGQDSVEGGVMAPGGEDFYSSVLGIDAADVATVEAECTTG